MNFWFFIGFAGFANVVTASSPKVDGKPPKVISYVVERELPHDKEAFTQGFEIWGAGYFLETTGQYGKSEIRKVEIDTGKVVLREPLDPKYFGEGATRVGQEIIQLTWREGTVLRWTVGDKSKGLTVKDTLPWSGEGWGVTRDKDGLWVSDGSSELKHVDAKTMKINKRLRVTLSGKPMDQLNELEMVDGKIFANVWMTSTVVRIDPKTGAVDGLMDLGSLVPKSLHPDAVANGIAWDGRKKRLYVTGKLWPKVFELRLN